MIRGTACALLAGLLAGGTPDEPVVWVFFSPDSPDASGIFAQLEGRPIRSALLVERYFGSAGPSDAFLATARTSGEVLVVDKEALGMARRLEIRDLPAVAVVRGDRAHVASGARVDVEELLKCSR